MLRTPVHVGMLLAVLVGFANAESQIGKLVADFTLDNCYGKPVTLSDVAQGKPTAIVFLGTECPLAKLYGPRLAEMQRRFDDKAVVIGVCSNKQDSITELVAYANRYDIHFPLLKDVGNRVADAMGAKRTPEVFLLDRDRKIRYHGRVDNQYGVGYSRKKADQHELARAIEELVSGNAVSAPETEVVGCHIGRVKQAEPTGQITYTKHIAPIFNERCVNCHREQEIAPFTLTSYEDIQGWEDTILEVIDEGRMPPWFADPKHGKFTNDARLNDEQKQLIATWIENGMPKGDPADLPEPPQFTVGWQIPEPDQVFKMSSKPFQVPAEGVVDYQHFVVDPGWTEDKYITAAEARPQNRGVVHHILVFVLPPGNPRIVDRLNSVLAGYAPGATPMLLEAGTAMKAKAGSKLLFQMHYTPNGYKQTDLSYVGVCFTTKDQVKTIQEGAIAINPLFTIPPHEANHEVIGFYYAYKDQWLTTMTPHMHLRGKAFKYEAVYPDGKTEILLNVPHYDFNWQLEYILEEPKLLPRGTMVKCTAVYDNSESNLANPNPDRAVGWGDQSWDEMMIGFMDTVPAEKGL